MAENKERIIVALSKALPAMTAGERTYLIGFVEGIAASAGNSRLRFFAEGPALAEPPESQQSSA